MTRFTDELWESISGDIYPGILKHPFLSGLTSGALPEACFRYYVLQDSTYLKAFGQGLAILASRADTPDAFMMFCEHARTTIIVEQALHNEFLSLWGDAPEPPAWNAMSPNGLLYTSYLLRVVHERPYHEAVAAFLPCYWIYRNVGNELVSKGSPNPLYQKWIDTYAGEEFGEVVKQVLNLVDTLAEELGEKQKSAMKQHFRRTSELEFLFWDAAWNKTRWPFEDGPE